MVNGSPRIQLDIAGQRFVQDTDQPACRFESAGSVHNTDAGETPGPAFDQEPIWIVSGRTPDVPNSSNAMGHARQGGDRSSSDSERVSGDVLPVEFSSGVAPPTACGSERPPGQRRAGGLLPRCGNVSPTPQRRVRAPCAENRNAASRADDPLSRAKGRPGRDMVPAKFTANRRKGPLSRIAPCGPSLDGLRLRMARSRCRDSALLPGPGPGQAPAPASPAAPARAQGPRTAPTAASA